MPTATSPPELLAMRATAIRLADAIEVRKLAGGAPDRRYSECITELADTLRYGVPDWSTGLSGDVRNALGVLRGALVGLLAFAGLSIEVSRAGTCLEAEILARLRAGDRPWLMLLMRVEEAVYLACVGFKGAV